MIELPVYNSEGAEVERMQVDEALLGGRVRLALLKQALVMYHANRRQGSAVTRGRSRKAGSNAKIYRQKGTGRARMGRSRTVVRRGGGVAFGKNPRDFRQRMPQQQRRLARNSAVLAKMLSQDTVVVDTLAFETPKTKAFVTLLANLKIDRSCLVAMENFDVNVYKSLRNIARVDVLEVDQLNAGDICRQRKLLFTKAALESLLAGAAASGASEVIEGG